MDTETTGIPSPYSGLDEQPYLVQIAAILLNSNKEPVTLQSRLVRPEGWTIPYEASAIHGFTTSACSKHGVPLMQAMTEFASMWAQATQVIAYNWDFDSQILDFSADRVGIRLPRRKSFCVMQEATKFVSANGRWPKLSAAYRAFFGKDFDNAHDAMADVQACKDIYFAIQDTSAPIKRVGGDIECMGPRAIQRAMSAAREIEEYQSLISSLVSLHHQPLPQINWSLLATDRPVLPPIRPTTNEERAEKQLVDYRPSFLERLTGSEHTRRQELEACVGVARQMDDTNYQDAIQRHREQVSKAKAQSLLARAVLASDMSAYDAALLPFDLCASPMIGRNVIHSFADSKTVEVFAYLNALSSFPDKTKSLLKSGKVSTKSAKRRDLLMLFQDHLCSAALRLTCDYFALLPLQRVLIHGYVPDPQHSNTLAPPAEVCALSCLIDRDSLRRQDLLLVDPSDCVESFPYRMTFKANKFDAVEPIALDPR